MKRVSSFSMLIIGIVQVVLGIWLIFADLNIVKIIFKLMGATFFILGLIQIISMIVKNKVNNYIESNLLSGALCIVIGIILYTKAGLALGVITAILAIWIMINGILQISSAVTVKNLGIKYWPIILIAGIIITLLGYFLITANEDTLGTILNVYVGISLGINGIGTIITSFYTKREVKVKVEAKVYTPKDNETIEENIESNDEKE